MLAWAVVLATTQLLLQQPAVAVPIVFTGDVVNDFPDTRAGVVVTPGIVPGGGRASGWSIVDVRFAYDADTDTAYFGAWR